MSIFQDKLEELDTKVTELQNIVEEQQKKLEQCESEREKFVKNSDEVIVQVILYNHFDIPESVKQHWTTLNVKIKVKSLNLNDVSIVTLTGSRSDVEKVQKYYIDNQQ